MVAADSRMHNNDAGMVQQREREVVECCVEVGMMVDIKDGEEMRANGANLDHTVGQHSTV
jgi:hypothetical protein